MEAELSSRVYAWAREAWGLVLKHPHLATIPVVGPGWKHLVLEALQLFVDENKRNPLPGTFRIRRICRDVNVLRLQINIGYAAADLFRLVEGVERRSENHCEACGKYPNGERPGSDPVLLCKECVASGMAQVLYKALPWQFDVLRSEAVPITLVCRRCTKRHVWSEIPITCCT